LYLIGCLMWLFGALFPQLVPWWTAFLVFTVAGERLELSRLRRPSSAAQTAYVAILAAIIIGLLVSLLNLGLGMRIMGLGLMVLALWLIIYDIARKTVRRKGITGYIGACLLTGFIWLAAGGLLWVLQGGRSTAGPLYDAMLHALLLGFVMSMIFGHGPVILPAVTGRSISYLPMFYIPLGLLHLTLILRISGDLLNQADLRKIGAIGNEVAILLFLLAMAAGVRQSRRDQSVQLAAKVTQEG